MAEPTRHVQRPTAVQGGLTHCACGLPWPTCSGRYSARRTPGPRQQERETRMPEPETDAVPACLARGEHGTRDVNALATALSASWAAGTSSTAGWSPQNPAAGQCAVTALVLQDYLGGTIMRNEINGQSHYFLRLACGTEIDLTREQFVTVRTATEAEPRDRAEVLSHSGTRQRYELLGSALALKTAAAAQEALDVAEGWDSLSDSQPPLHATLLRTRAFELREAIFRALTGEGE